MCSPLLLSVFNSDKTVSSLINAPALINAEMFMSVKTDMLATGPYNKTLPLLYLIAPFDCFLSPILFVKGLFLGYVVIVLQNTIEYHGIVL